MWAGVQNSLHVKLVPGRLEYTGPVDLSVYYLVDVSMTTANSTSYPVVTIVFGRRLLGTFLTIYAPTILLLIIAIISNYFPSNAFVAMFTVNLTGQKRII